MTHWIHDSSYPPYPDEPKSGAQRAAIALLTEERARLAKTLTDVGVNDIRNDKHTKAFAAFLQALEDLARHNAVKRDDLLKGRQEIGVLLRTGSEAAVECREEVDPKNMRAQRIRTAEEVESHAEYVDHISRLEVGAALTRDLIQGLHEQGKDLLALQDSLTEFYRAAGIDTQRGR
jgi:hypothetical protein